SGCRRTWQRASNSRALRIRDVKDHTITVRASVTKVTGTGFVEGATKTHRTRWVPVPEVVWDRLEYAIITDADKPDRLVFRAATMATSPILSTATGLTRLRKK